jgi:hypothetical protein
VIGTIYNPNGILLIPFRVGPVLRRIIIGASALCLATSGETNPPETHNFTLFASISDQSDQSDSSDASSGWRW